MVHIFLTPWKWKKTHQALVNFNFKSCTCQNIYVTNTTSIWCSSTRFYDTPLVHDASNNDIVVGFQFLHLVIKLIKFNKLVLVQLLNGSINCIINPFLVNWVNLIVNFSSVTEFFIILESIIFLYSSSSLLYFLHLESCFWFHPCLACLHHLWW